MKKKMLSVMLCGFMMLSLTACSTKKSNGIQQEEKPKEEVQDTTPTADAKKEVQEATPTVDAKEEATPTPDAKDMVKELTYQDFDAFAALQKAAIPCEFQSTRDMDDWEKPYDITGSFDLNQDSAMDSISFHYDPVATEYTLQINDATLKDALPAPDKFYIIDLDQRDTYKELVLYDDGMSGDPTFLFYRYDGTQIMQLGIIGTLSDSSIAFDGYGRIVKGDTFLYRLEPSIIPDYFELEGNELKNHEFEISEVVGKKYKIHETLTAFFDETYQGSIKEDYEVDWTEEAIEKNEIELKAGDLITLKEIGSLERYLVELPDGRTGLLYFWIGD